MGLRVRSGITKSLEHRLHTQRNRVDFSFAQGLVKQRLGAKGCGNALEKQEV